MSTTVVVHNKASNAALKIVLVLIIVSALTIAAVSFIAEEKRVGLLKAWDELAREKGIQLPKNYIKRQLDRLNIFDLNVLIKFSEALKKREIMDIMDLMPEVRHIIMRKTDLGLLQGILEILINIGT